jgi:hypothetical protein
MTGLWTSSAGLLKIILTCSWHWEFAPGDLGSHSTRKGASSYASAGSTVCPPMVSIYLHAMWSIGSVKERYLQYKKAGDQYLGRVVSGLDVNSIAFATSPPFFDTADQDERDQIWSLVKVYIVGGGGGGSTPKTRSPVTYSNCFIFFALFCSHFGFLIQTLPKKNKLHASPFLTGIPNLAKERATVRFPWNRTDATPTFTGLPSHICIPARTT